MIRYFNIKDYFNKVKRYYNNIPPSKPLFINTENREDYLEIKNRLELMANITNISSYCKLEDDNPDLLCLIEDIDKETENIFINGLTTFLKLLGEEELKNYMRIFLNKEFSCNVIVLCFQIEDPLIDFINNDNRIERQISLIKGKADNKFKIDFYSEQLEFENKKCLIGIRNLLIEMENNHRFEYAVFTKKKKYDYKNSLILIKDLSEPYNILSSQHEFFRGIDSSSGTDEQWCWLLKELSSQISLKEFLLKEIGIDSNFEVIFERWKIFNENQRWLYFIVLKIYGIKSNSYLKIVIENTKDFSCFITNLFREILKIDYCSKEFLELYKKRKYLLKVFDEDINYIIDFCNYANIKGKDKLFYLTDISIYEKQEVIKLLSIYEYDEDLLNKFLPKIYSDLGLYLNTYFFNKPLLDEYFEKYKKLKIKNKVEDSFLNLVKENALTRKFNQEIPLRSEKTEQIDKTETYTYFVDALGVEFLGYILGKCKKNEIFADVTICRSNLPSITSENKEFLLEFDPEHTSSIKELDEVKHHGMDNYDYQKTKLPIHIVKELSIIEELLNRVKEKLLSGQYKKVILISDHGASRFAVTHANILNDFNIDLKGIHSGRCSKIENENSIPKIEFATEERGYLVIADYSRFKGSRAASVEAHGGATLEEIIVPIIELSINKIEHEIKLKSHIITISFRKKAKLEIFSKNKIDDVTLKLNVFDNVYTGETIDNQNFSFEFPEIRKVGEYFAAIYSKNNLIKSNIKFIVEKEGSKEKDLF